MKNVATRFKLQPIYPDFPHISSCTMNDHRRYDIYRISMTYRQIATASYSVPVISNRLMPKSYCQASVTVL